MKDDLGDNIIPNYKISQALGFDITDVDFDLQEDVVDTQDYYEMQMQSEARDKLIDSVIMENAKLKSAKDYVIYQLLDIKIENEMIKYEDLKPEEKALYDTNKALKE